MRVAILMLICHVGSGATLASNSCASLDSIRWLLGDWSAKSDTNSILESWTEVSSRTFEGRGETRHATSNELLAGESMRILELAGELFYLAKVGHNELPVAFKLTSCSDTVAVFENDGHDFPKRLEYRRSGKDELLVHVTDGVDRGFKLRFVRTD